MQTAPDLKQVISNAAYAQLYNCENIAQDVSDAIAEGVQAAIQSSQFADYIKQIAKETES